MVIGVPAITGAGARQTDQVSGSSERIRIVLGGYGPSTSSFSRGLKLIGDRLDAEFGESVEIEYVYNILEQGYAAPGDLRRLVDNGVLSLAYLTMFEGIPELELAAIGIADRQDIAERVVAEGGGQRQVGGVDDPAGEIAFLRSRSNPSRRAACRERSPLSRRRGRRPGRRPTR